MEDFHDFIADQNKQIELANALIENAEGNEAVIRLANEFIKSCNKAILIAQKRAKNLHCSDCKLDFYYVDSDIIDDVWVICPDCGSKICILE